MVRPFVDYNCIMPKSHIATRKKSALLNRAIAPEGRMVIKRNGDLVPFDRNKISRAISLAFYEQQHGTATNPHRDDPASGYGLVALDFQTVEVITEQVVRMLDLFYRNGQHPTIEQVQDAAEKALAAADHWEVARSFMLYRTRRAEHRLQTYAYNGMGDYVGMAKYARYRPDLGRRETWVESAARVRDMHIEFFWDKIAKPLPEFSLETKRLAGGRLDLLTKHVAGRTLADLIRESFDQVALKKVLPSMRAMQFGGQAILKNHARQFNCAFSNVDRLEFFREYFFLLLSGTGVGFSVRKHHIDHLPKIALRGDKLAVSHHAVQDTIEGWANALHALLMAYVKGYHVEFNYSQIRDEGQELKTSGGRAPGHLPLREALRKAETVLQNSAGRKLRPIEVYDLCMHIAKAVLSGGIRRSATICLFSPDDEEMMNAKTGDWFSQNPQRAGSNNSAAISRHEDNRALFDKLFEAQKAFGEPGFYFTDGLDEGCNPCVTADTWVRTTEGTKQVKDLVGKPFKAMVNGLTFDSTEKGFFSTGIKPVVQLVTEVGHSLNLTANHAVLSFRKGPGNKTESFGWNPTGTLARGDRVVLHDPERLALSDICRITPEGKIGLEIPAATSTALVKSIEPLGTEEVYDCTIPGAEAFDANGIYVHNCVEIGLDPVWRELEQPNKSGIQLCNLTSINGAQTTSEEEFYLACIWAAFIGTLQAAYTRIPFLGPVTQKINERDALLGVSLCGVMDNPDVLLDPKILTNGAHLVRAVNVWLAEFLGINPSARSTCVKPEGTASLVLGAASGIHPHHAPMYFRRVTANRLEPIYTFFKARNPQMTEVSVYNPERDDKIVFPVKAPEGAICRKDIGAVQFLEIVKLVQQAWVIPGNRDKDSKINHNVSNTCTVKAEEWDAVREFIWTNRAFFTGISLLAWEGDKRYAQAPNEEVTTEGDIAKWNALKPVVVDYSQMQEATDETKLSEVAACANGQCDLK